jgi:hypothetical protein
MEMLLFLFLVPGRLPRNDWSQVLISCYCIFCFRSVPRRSQVIRSYGDDCSRSCFSYCSYYKSIILVGCFPLLLLVFQAGHG